MDILFASGGDEDARAWLPALERALPAERFFLEPRESIEVVLAAGAPVERYAGLPRLKLVQSLWMGVEKLVADPAFPPAVPLARMVDPGMVAAMSETVLAHVLDWHRHLHAYRGLQAKREWKRLPQRLASDRSIALLGLGELGRDAAAKLAALGFRVRGLSRRPKTLAGVAASTDLDAVASEADVVVCLLPLTPATRGILDARLFSLMRPGGAVINAARGAHLVAPDLLEALDSGRLARAWLDVFEREPLPPEDPLWSHPGVTLTPHVAALTEPRTAAPVVAENVGRLRRGAPLLHLVDREAGY